jgi:hypothetical protein
MTEIQIGPVHEVRILDRSDPLQREMFEELRYFYWVIKHGWAPAPADPASKREGDAYDPFAIHFGLFAPGGVLVGYSRIVLGGGGKRLHLCAKFGLGRLPHRLNRAVEISRMIVTDDVPRGVARKIGSVLLYRSMYQWAKLHDRPYWYIEAERWYIEGLRAQGFPFRELPVPPQVDDKDVTTFAAVLDLADAEAMMFSINPEGAAWFVEGLPEDIAIRQPRPALKVAS